MKLRCQCGVESNEFADKDRGVIGEMRRQTGFFWFMFVDGNSAWFCRTCARIVCNGYSMIESVMGSRARYISTNFMDKYRRELGRGTAEDADAHGTDGGSS